MGAGLLLGFSLHFLVWFDLWLPLVSARRMVSGGAVDLLIVAGGFGLLLKGLLGGCVGRCVWFVWVGVGFGCFADELVFCGVILVGLICAVG